MSTLNKLLVDQQELDRDALGRALLPLIRIGNDGTFRPVAGWSKLSKIQRVLVILLAGKASQVLGVRDDESLSAAEVATLSGVAGNTSRPVLRTLVERGIAAQDRAGRYFIQNMAVPDALSQLPTPAE
jgi:hypothetical protein